MKPGTIFQQAKNTLPSIESVYMYVSVDPDDGNEGIVGAPLEPVGCMPMVAADEKRLAQLTPIAEEIAKRYKMKIRLIKLSHREVIKEINP
jgi:hypothetical protein